VDEWGRAINTHRKLYISFRPTTSTQGSSFINLSQVVPPTQERIVVELYDDKSPLAVENFMALCTGEKGKCKNCPNDLHYKGCRFHRVVKDFICQVSHTWWSSPFPSFLSRSRLRYCLFTAFSRACTVREQTGDFVMGNGTGGESIWAKKFKDEPKGLKLKHDGPGILSMCNSGYTTRTTAPHYCTTPLPVLTAPPPLCTLARTPTVHSSSSPSARASSVTGSTWYLARSCAELR
jgi:cyclophilin family peptidyl-prolyl cis-trans isomerase